MIAPLVDACTDRRTLLWAVWMVDMLLKMYAWEVERSLVEDMLPKALVREVWSSWVDTKVIL